MPAVTSSIMRKRAAMPTSKPKKLGVMKLSEMDALAEKNAATGGASSRGPDARRRDPRDATSDALTLPTDHRYDAGSAAAPAGDHPATPSPTVRRSDTARVLRHPRPTPRFSSRQAAVFCQSNGYRRYRTRETYPSAIAPPLDAG